jgi:hypothetical protein
MPAALSSDGITASFMSPSYTAVFRPIACAGTVPSPAVALTVTLAEDVCAAAGRACTPAARSAAASSAAPVIADLFLTMPVLQPLAKRIG